MFARNLTHIEDLALLHGSLCQRLVDQPTALVVQDVGPDFSNLFRRAVAVEVVVLDLEVLAHGDQDVERFLERRGGRDAGHVEREGDGEVERVVGGFVDDNEVVPVVCVFIRELETHQRGSRGVTGRGF